MKDVSFGKKIVAAYRKAVVNDEIFYPIDHDRGKKVAALSAPFPVKQAQKQLKLGLRPVKRNK